MDDVTHDSETWSGLCSDCGKPVSIGTRCPTCAVQSLLRADIAAGERRAARQRLLAEHGRCWCILCLVARGEERIERAEVTR